jgi:predicted DNA-binding transcriptional regulator AlpA
MTDPEELISSLEAEERKIIRLREIAELTQLAESTLRWYRSRGRGPKMFRLGRGLAAYEDDVKDWLAAQAADGHTRINSVMAKFIAARWGEPVYHDSGPHAGEFRYEMGPIFLTPGEIKFLEGWEP